MWLIVCLVGLGLALAAYQQQRRSAVEVAEVPRDEDPATEAGADPAAPPEEPSGAETKPAPAVEAERFATLDQQDRGRPGESSELRTGPTAARPESEELAVSREPAESSGGSLSGASDPPAPPPEREQAEALPAAGDRPGPDLESPAAGGGPTASRKPAEPQDREAAPPSQVAAPPQPAPPPSPEQQLTASTESPTGEAGSRQEDEPQAEALPAAPKPGSESLVADTIRRALAALLGDRTDELVQPLEPAEPEQPEPRDKLAGQSPTAPQLAAVEPQEAPQEAKPDLTAPSFDVVRVQRGGQAVVAGRAAPGAEVELRAGGELIDRVRADQRGQWVSVPQRPLPPGDQELTVAARSGDALPIHSEQVVVLAVPGTEPTSGKSDHPAAAAVALEAPDDQALAVLLPKDGRGQGRVLQAPGRIGSDGQLALLMLDYDETGQIRLSGEATPGAVVRVYVDNRLSAETVAGEDGRWTCELDRTLAPGTYTLRVDQLDRSGQPVARLETPFTRVAQPPVQGDVLVDYVIVQPGNSLWRIARRLFGSGFEYVHIYEANQTQIRDPDLIYPGQVFEIPVGMGSAG